MFRLIKHGGRWHGAARAVDIRKNVVVSSCRRTFIASNLLKSKSWAPSSSTEIERVTSIAMSHDLVQDFTSSANDTVPWFLGNMPHSYFRQTEATVRMEHLRALTALRHVDTELSVALKSKLPDGRRVFTNIVQGDKPGVLMDQIKRLPKYEDRLLERVGIYTATDDSVCINVFTFSDKDADGRDGRVSRKSHPESIEGPVLELAQKVHSGDIVFDGLDGSLCTEEKVRDYMGRCGESYLTNGVKRRLLKQMGLFYDVSGTEGVAASVEPFNPDEYTGEKEAVDGLSGKSLYWVDTAVANSLPQYALEYFSRVMNGFGLSVVRAHMDNITDYDNGTVTMLRMLVSVVDEGQAPDFRRIQRNLKRQKWIDPMTVDLTMDRHPWLGIKRGEIITCFASLLHPILGKVNPVAYSKANILDTVTSKKHIALSSSIADMFIKKFDPSTGKLGVEELSDMASSVRERIDAEVVDRSAITMLKKMVNVVESTMRTNLFLEDRYALSLRLDPSIMHSEEAAEDSREYPYGVLFCHGRRFNGYHVRFRDIARGGMRLVTPSTTEQLALESGRHYDECYGLSFAQQMKNKDIPEGGSKCVCLIDTIGMSRTNKEFVMRKAVKAFSDGMLDLIVDNEETKENVVDYYGKDEVLYLGPDEQVSVRVRAAGVILYIYIYI